jgi:hypothetical protein
VHHPAASSIRKHRPRILSRKAPFNAVAIWTWTITRLQPCPPPHACRTRAAAESERPPDAVHATSAQPRCSRSWSAASRSTIIQCGTGALDLSRMSEALAVQTNKNKPGTVTNYPIFRVSPSDAACRRLAAGAKPGKWGNWGLSPVSPGFPGFRPRFPLRPAPIFPAIQPQQAS